jgi:hypothetical protein
MRFLLFSAIALLPFATVATPYTAGRVFPGGVSNFDYFYVYGPSGARFAGRDDSVCVFFVKVPSNTTEPVRLRVFDPGANSAIVGHEAGNRGSVGTSFAVYGGKAAYSSAASQLTRPDWKQAGTELASHAFIENYDGMWADLGSFDASKGERVGDAIYFKVVVTAPYGSGGNRFKLAALPGTAELITYNLTLHAAGKSGDVLSVDVLAPAGASTIVECNFDLDHGGKARVGTADDAQELKGSFSGFSRRNAVTVSPRPQAHLVRYDIIKGRQERANVGLFFTDLKANPLPIFVDATILFPIAAK